MLGFEVESQHSTVPKLDGVVVARVAACQAHPRSEHLKICTVETGREKVQVICGAPNVAVDQLVAFASPGTLLPNGVRIEKRNILGVESSGMICSGAELGISEEADEILVLNGRARTGEALGHLLETDSVFEVNVTPNRADCLGIIGIAREVAALERKALRLPKPTFRETGEKTATSVKVEIHDLKACPRYAARLLRNVRIGPSPDWLARRLRAIGLRPIFNIVDATNYVMMETGQPLHAFDFAHITDGRIVVRKAAADEQFQTLDGKMHPLSSDDLLICDALRPVALAGVMGGLNSEVSSSTRDVLLECACFEPLGIRRTAKRLGIRSESAHRFERGVDPNGIPYALDRAAAIMLRIAGGEAHKGTVDLYPRKALPATVTFRPPRASQLVGKALRGTEMASIFKRLHFAVDRRRKDRWKVRVPTFRPDLTREIDLIEEIARLHGYERIQPIVRAPISLQHNRNCGEDGSERIRRLLTGMGMFEAVSLSLLAPRHAELFLPASAQALRLRNPLSEELSALRPSVLATLLASVAYNINRKNDDFGLFEIGSVFWRTTAGHIGEARHVGGVLTGNALAPSWRDCGRALESADIRGILEILADRLHLPGFSFVVQEGGSCLCEGWSVHLAGKPVGFAGRIDQACLTAYGIENAVYAFELDLNSLLEQIDWHHQARAIPRFPAIERDISIVVDANVSAERIGHIIREAGAEFLEGVALFDLYVGPPIAPGQKGMAYALRFRAPDRTLREDEVDVWQANIVRCLHQEVAATIRT